MITKQFADFAKDGFIRDWHCPHCGTRAIVRDHSSVWARDEDGNDVRSYRYEVRCGNSGCEFRWKLFSDVDAEFVDDMNYRHACDNRNAKLAEDVLDEMVKLEVIEKKRREMVVNLQSGIEELDNA